MTNSYLHKIGLEKRIEAYQCLQELKLKRSPRPLIVRLIKSKFGISSCTCYSCLNDSQSPYGVLGKLEQKRDLFYVLGVLLGDGYIYHWKSFYSVGILVKNKSFAMKFAEHLSKCIGREVFAYCSKKRMLWFVRIGNFELFTLFKNFRNDLNFKKAIEVMPKEDALQFIEGFFDAEGCVKIIKENIRQTPKVCLDFTNTNREVLEAVKQLLKVFLQVEARFSVQHDKRDNRKTVYHLRIYKKDYVRIFFENVQTIKLSKEKALYLEKWLQHNVTVKL